MNMKIKFYRPRPAIFMGGAVLLLSLGACRQRTADNMVPDGDTVEVIVNPSATPENATDTLTTIDIHTDEN